MKFLIENLNRRAIYLLKTYVDINIRVLLFCIDVRILNNPVCTKIEIFYSTLSYENFMRISSSQHKHIIHILELKYKKFKIKK